MLSKSEERAVKIVELQEELEQAKRIIEHFVWPPDATKEQHQAFVQKAARFAGVPIPQYLSETEQNEQTGRPTTGE